MKKQYAFIFDTASSWELLNKEHDDIYITPILINEEKDGEFITYSDSVDITRDELNNKLDTGCNLSTAQPNKLLLQDKINSLLEQYEKILILPISIDLSGFWTTLKTMQKEYEDKLIVLNSRSIGIDGNWIIQELREKLADGSLTLDEAKINEWLENRYKRVCGTLTVNSLDQLIKGGRIKGAKAFFAKAFKIKVSIRFHGDLNCVSKDLSIQGAIAKSLKEIDDNNHFMTKGIKHISIMNDLKNQEVGQKLTEMILTKLKLSGHEPSLLPDSILMHVGTDTFSILIEANE